MQRRRFSREFKVEAVRLMKDRGVSVAQAARDLDVHENVLRKCRIRHHGQAFGERGFKQRDLIAYCRTALS
jgi:transposase-like protein